MLPLLRHRALHRRHPALHEVLLHQVGANKTAVSCCCCSSFAYLGLVVAPGTSLAGLQSKVTALPCTN